MARLRPLDAGEIPESHHQFLGFWNEFQGFELSDLQIMARNHAILQDASRLTETVVKSGYVSTELKYLVAHVVSRAAGCRYCSGHTAVVSNTYGASEKKISEVWDFESSDEFDEAERAALRLALAAGVTPNAVTDEQFADLRSHFSDEEIVELVAMIAVMGFWNRWNDTMKTDLESAPERFVEKVLDAAF